MKCTNRSRRAFSFMELLAVVVILGIIAALIVPRLVISSERAKESTCHHSRAQINTAVERYFIHTGNWPVANLSDMASDVQYFPNGLPVCPISSQPYRIDPMTHRVIGHAGATDHSP